MSNQAHGLTAQNLLATLPKVLRDDEGMHALASAIVGALATQPAELDSLRIYSRIDELPEEILDVLAHDFKVDWWDPDYTLEEKRSTLKESWRVHRLLGTKAAVEMAISAIYPETKVQEWFEYGGEPYHFRLLLDATLESIDPEKHRRVLEKVSYYKNLRSVLDTVDYYDTGGAVMQFFGAAFLGGEIVDGATAVAY